MSSTAGSRTRAPSELTLRAEVHRRFALTDANWGRASGNEQRMLEAAEPAARPGLYRASLHGLLAGWSRDLPKRSAWFWGLPIPKRFTRSPVVNLLVRDQVTTCLTRRHSCDNLVPKVTNSVTSHTTQL